MISLHNTLEVEIELAIFVQHIISTKRVQYHILF